MGRTNTKVKTMINTNEKHKTLRPSSIGSFINCNYQWYNTHIMNVQSIPNARATLGSSIHKSAEVIWLDAINKGKKDLNLTMAVDAAVEEYHELLKLDDPQFDDNENKDTIEKEVIQGTTKWVEDIAPNVDIPIAVEKFYETPVDNPIFTRVAGSIDYVGANSIHDIKTSRKKPTLKNYDLQQATYAILREKNGETIDTIKIQSVILGKKEIKAEVYDLIQDSTDHFKTIEDIKKQTKYIINNILQKSKLLQSDKIDPKIIFTGNPNSFLCSNKYCALYDTCPFVKGT